MNNDKKNVHNTGALGMLVRTGQIKKVDSNESSTKPQQISPGRFKASATSSYFRTQAGIEFNENELDSIDPKECESWEYANRSSDEMGDMDELIKSISENKQLQPALIRRHPNPHDGIKYQIIFGKRRHAACLALNIPFLVIKKDSLTKQEAIACQDAENKFRKNVSNYSNSILYKKLLDDGSFKSEKELAEKLRISTSSMNDLMSYTKIPEEIICDIPDVHALSVNMALKIAQLLNSNISLKKTIRSIAPEIGKSITSAAKLEKTLQNILKLNAGAKESPVLTTARIIQSEAGKKLFTLKVDRKGAPCFVIHKSVLESINLEKLCNQFKESLENELEHASYKSGHPDMVN
jgi:ParB family chromosome partitioning protein